MKLSIKLEVISFILMILAIIIDVMANMQRKKETISYYDKEVERIRQYYKKRLGY